MPQPAIADYAAIGDCRTVALVSRLGGIDWFCPGEFSAPSVFAALLDWQRGGRFAVDCRDLVRSEQDYLSATNVLCTRIATASGVLEITDFMPLHYPLRDERWRSHPGRPQQIVRILECREGSVELTMRVACRPAYAAERPHAVASGGGCWQLRSHSLAATLTSDAVFTADGSDLVAPLTLRAGERSAAVLEFGGDSVRPREDVHAFARSELQTCLGRWREWAQSCVYDGPYRDEVMRSALTLKLLNHVPTGAVVAAATTSLPESDEGGRNWDYRFCWLRDTSLVLNGFIDIGYPHEGDAFLRWLLHATRGTGRKLQVVYDVHGKTLLEERTLTTLSGWNGIGPVRIGNAASRQAQHDIYGEVLVTACDHVERGGRLDARERELLAGFAQEAMRVWREPDQGIWEIRLPPRHNTHSKLMCWAALDRALKLDSLCGLPIDRQGVTAERERIREDIDTHGFDAAIGSYVGFYGSDAADAALLLMPRLGYLEPKDPRMLGTVRHVMQQLGEGGLLYRYPPGGAYDGVDGPEHLFAICSFWAVDCLARQGRLDEADALFRRLLALRNHAGLYAEEFERDSGRPMGNFPQAFSHVGLINAALSLQAARSGA